RGLLRTLEPDQVARRVAGALFEGTNAAQTACAIRNNGKGLAVCVFDHEGGAGDASLSYLNRLEAWLKSAASAKPLRLTNRRGFLFRDRRHAREYLIPIGFGEQNSGAVLVAFAREKDCTDTECRLIDLAAQ